MQIILSEWWSTFLWLFNTCWALSAFSMSLVRVGCGCCTQTQWRGGLNISSATEGGHHRHHDLQPLRPGHDDLQRRRPQLRHQRYENAHVPRVRAGYGFLRSGSFSVDGCRCDGETISDLSTLFWRLLAVDFSDTFTDTAISSSRINGEHKEKVLQRWDGGDSNGESYDLETDAVSFQHCVKFLCIQPVTYY